MNSRGTGMKPPSPCTGSMITAAIASGPTTATSMRSNASQHCSTAASSLRPRR